MLDSLNKLKVLNGEGNKTEEEHVSIEIPEGWYSSPGVLIDSINDAIRERFFKRSNEEGVTRYMDLKSFKTDVDDGGGVWKPFYINAHYSRYLCGKSVCDNYVDFVIFRNNTFHEARIEMCSQMASAIGLPTAFRLRGGSIEESQRIYDEPYQKRLEWEQEGIKPSLNTSFPRFLAVTSPIASHGLLGRELERVITVLECGERVGVNGVISFYPSETNFVSAEPGRYESIECGVMKVFDDKSSLYDVIGKFKMDLAIMIKSNNA